jgi:hypothetical protein
MRNFPRFFRQSIRPRRGNLEAEAGKYFIIFRHGEYTLCEVIEIVFFGYAGPLHLSIRAALNATFLFCTPLRKFCTI